MSTPSVAPRPAGSAKPMPSATAEAFGHAWRVDIPDDVSLTDDFKAAALRELSYAMEFAASQLDGKPTSHEKLNDAWRQLSGKAAA